MFNVLEEIDKKYNSYQPGSFIDLINKNSGHFVEVDHETINILQQIIELSNYFNGSYDITIMPLIRLWGFYKENQQKIPKLQEIERIKHLVDYKKIEIKGNKVKIAEGQEIITGSCIKAYAVDQLAQKMIQTGITDAIINAGGSTIKAINNESHPFWQILVREPENEELLFKLNIQNQCYSTSSQAKTFVEINGKKYGHILNPKTGYPSTNKQMGIISDSCMVGDIISTGLFNETKQGFLLKTNLLSQNYNIKGFLIDEDNNITYSKGFSNKN